MRRPTSVPETQERELDKEAEQEFEAFVESEREHQAEDEQRYADLGDEDFDADVVEDDPHEYEQG